MAGNTRANILRRRQRVEELLADGLEDALVIAERLATEGIKACERTVRDDISLIGKAWEARIVGLRHVRQMRLVRDADWRKSELESEWERSKKDRQRNRAKQRKAVKELQPSSKADQSEDNSQQEDEVIHQ